MSEHQKRISDGMLLYWKNKKKRTKTKEDIKDGDCSGYVGGERPEDDCEICSKQQWEHYEDAQKEVKDDMDRTVDGTDTDSPLCGDVAVDAVMEDARLYCENAGYWRGRTERAEAERDAMQACGK